MSNSGQFISQQKEIAMSEDRYTQIRKEVIQPRFFEIPLPRTNQPGFGSGPHRYAALFEALGIVVEFTCMRTSQQEESLIANSVAIRKATDADHWRESSSWIIPDGRSDSSYDGWPIIEAAIAAFAKFAHEEHYKNLGDA